MAAKKGKVIDEQGNETEDSREAPPERQKGLMSVILPVLSQEQMKAVLFKTPDHAKLKRQGRGNKVMTYVKHGWVTDQLNKIFGFDWDLELIPMADGKMYALEIEQLKDGSETRHVAVCGRLVMRIHRKDDGEVFTTITKAGFGSQIWLPTMELGDALKAARSDLLKTCASQVGIALDLYWDDQAEFAQYNKRKEEEEAKQREAEAMAKELARGVPSSGILLIARANSDYKLDGDALEAKLNKTLDEVMKMNAEELSLAWHVISGD